MSNLKELLAQRAAIDAQIAEQQSTERANAIGEIKALMNDYGITVQDLSAPKARATARNTVAAKFKDPKTGETWSGRGLMPKWLKAKTAEGLSVEAFRVATEAPAGSQLPFGKNPAAQ